MNLSLVIAHTTAVSAVLGAPMKYELSISVGLAPGLVPAVAHNRISLCRKTKREGPTIRDTTDVQVPVKQEYIKSRDERNEKVMTNS